METSILLDDIEQEAILKTKGGYYSIQYDSTEFEKIIGMAVLANKKMGFIPCVENLDLLLCGWMP